jgi:hypothetical protein
MGHEKRMLLAFYPEACGQVEGIVVEKQWEIVGELGCGES